MPLIPIEIILETEFETFNENLTGFEQNLLKSMGFNGQNKKIAYLYDELGEIKKVLLGAGKAFNAQICGILGRNLEAGEYEFANLKDNKIADEAYLAYLLGRYYFDKFKKSPRKDVKINAPQNSNAQKLEIIANAINYGRDLVNLPANLMGTEDLAFEAKKLAQEFNCVIDEIDGDDLKQNYPLIEAVGRAGPQKPRFIIIRKPKKNAPKIGIIGKGVCFDTGGLNLKTGIFMNLMKKDMGGAACALSLSRILLEFDLPIDLNIYLPIVENSVASDAMRPSDILNSRKGLKVEIDNTDAEGRLILADALTRASEDKMETIIDFATLTGAARVALGPELPPFYTNDEEMAQNIINSAREVNDPLWQMPLWENYNDDFDSTIADLKNSGSAFAGSITAALFLQKFVDCPSWVHLDVYCWNPKEKNLGPMGGEIQGVRAIFESIMRKYVL